MNKIFRLTYRILVSSLDISTIGLFIIMPVGYLIIMGLMMGSIVPYMYFNGLKISYVTFIAPGVVADQILIGGSLAGWILWQDKRIGMLEQIFSLPYTRFHYLIGNLISMIIVTFAGAILMTLVAIPFISLKISILGMLLVIVFLILGTFIFGSIMLALGAVVKSNQVFNLISNIVIFLVTFASSVFYPITSETPLLLKVIAEFNPLTYVVDGIRSAYLNQIGIKDIYEFFILLILSIVFMAIATVAYRKIKLSATV
ncbi:MAG: ABC transporter permease [Candidatus Nanopusillus acidilobi]|jgi:ABC-2 type transport system permease protein|nr:ABC transporter permease [Euryarchaeota archaeon]